MNKQQLLSFMDLVEATIDKKIERAFGRDYFYESIRVDDFREKLLELFEIEEMK